MVELALSSMRSVVELVTSVESQTEWGSVVEDGRKGRTRREPWGRGVSSQLGVESQSEVRS